MKKQLNAKLEKFEMAQASQTEVTFIPINSSFQYCDRRFRGSAQSEERLMCKFNIDYFYDAASNMNNIRSKDLCERFNSDPYNIFNYQIVYKYLCLRQLSETALDDKAV